MLYEQTRIATTDAFAAMVGETGIGAGFEAGVDGNEPLGSAFPSDFALQNMRCICCKTCAIFAAKHGLNHLQNTR